MSRGHGWRQRVVFDLLIATEAARREGLPLAALRPALGSDRANARRLVRSLIDRGDCEMVVDEVGVRRLRATWLAAVSLMLRREGLGDEEPEPVEGNP
jgi:hypothetical protein